MFAGLSDLKRPGEYPYPTMGEDRAGDEGSLRCRQPLSGRMVREIAFDDPSETHRVTVLDAYRGL